MEERIVCQSDSCKKDNTFHKNSAIVEAPNGDLLATWFAGNHSEGNRDQNIFGSRLREGDDEWAESQCWVDVDGRALGCPVLFMGPDDNVWLIVPQFYGEWLTGTRLFYKRSKDHGNTWMDLELLTDETGLYLKNKPLHLENENRWILGVDVLHSAEDKPAFLIIPSDHQDRPGDFPYRVGGDQIMPTDPEGGIWDRPGFIYPTAVELSNGDLLAYMRPRQEPGYLYETRSTDRGLNWSEAERTNIPNPDAGFDIVRTDSGNLILINNPISGSDIPYGRHELAIFMSEDDGESWPYQLYLENEKRVDLGEMDQVGRPEFTYGNVIQSDGGEIHITYECRRNSIKHVKTTVEEIIEKGSKTTIVEEIT